MNYVQFLKNGSNTSAKKSGTLFFMKFLQFRPVSLFGIILGVVSDKKRSVGVNI
jgi:hypothetical protein